MGAASTTFAGIVPKQPAKTIFVGDTVYFSTTAEMLPPLQWRVSDEAVAVISSTGKFIAQSTGGVKVFVKDANNLEDSTAQFFVFPSAAKSITVSLRDTSAKQLKFVKIPVYVSNLSALKITSLQFSLLFNSSVLHSYGIIADTSTLIKNWMFEHTINASAGTIDVSAYGIEPLNDNGGILFYLYFQVDRYAFSPSMLLPYNVVFNENFLPKSIGANFNPLPGPQIFINKVPAMQARGETFSAIANGGTPPYAWVSMDTNIVSINSVTGVGKAKQRGAVDIRAYDSEGYDGAITVGVYDVRAGFKDTLIYSTDTIVVPLYISSMTGAEIVSQQMKIQYPAATLKFIDALSEGTLSQTANPTVNDEIGTLRIGMAQGNDFVGSGTLLKLRFKPLAIPSNNYFWFSEYLLNEPGPNSPTVLPQPATITVQEKPNNAPFFVFAPNDTSVNENDSLVAQFVAIDTDGDSVRYYFAAGSIIPFGAYLDTISGRLAWRPNYFQQGNYLYKIGVKDSKGAHGEAKSFNVIVKNVNRLPKIQTVFPDTFFVNVMNALSFTVTATDSDNDPISYSVQNAPAGASISISTGNFTWTPLANQAGFYQFSVIASDTAGGSDSKTIKVRVIKPNSPPAFTLGPRDTIISENQNLQMQIFASDADNDSLIYSSANNPQGMTINTKTGILTWTPNFSQAGSYTILVSVTDNKSAPISGSMKITVNNVNRPPFFTAVLPDIVIYDTTNLAFQYLASDPDGDNLTFSLLKGPAGASITSNGKFSYSPARNTSGIFSVIIAVSDAEFSVPDTATIVVVQINGAPYFTKTLPDTSIAANVPFQFQYAAADPDNDPLTFVKISVPNGVSVSASGLLTWEPTLNQLGTFPIVVAVTDGKGGTADTAFVTVQKQNRAPYFTAVMNDTVMYDTSKLSFKYQAFDPDGDPLIFSLAKPINGASISETGDFLFAPPKNTSGLFTIIVNVTDGEFIVVDTASVIVSRVNGAPKFVNVLPDTTIESGKAFQFQYTAFDPDGDTLTFVLVPIPATPINVKISSSGLLTWTPTSFQLGKFQILVAVTDGKGGAVDTAFITVVKGNNPPYFTKTLPDTLIFEEQNITFTYRAADSENDPLTYSIVHAPSGAGISSSGVFTWIPTSAQIGEHTIIIRVSDDKNLFALDTAFILVKKINRPPFFTKVLPDTTIAENQQLTFAYQASDPENSPITFSLRTQFEGMTLTSDGILNWKPNFKQSGLYRIIVESSDGVNIIPDTANITVTNVNRPPRFTLVLPDTTLRADSAIQFFYAAVDDDGEEVSFSIFKAPSNAAITAAGKFTWKSLPAQIGRNTIIIRATDGNAFVNDTAVVTVAGYTIAQVVKSSVDFGTINFGDVRKNYFTVRNNGYIPLLLQQNKNFTLSEHFKLDSSTITILPNELRAIGVTYTPKNSGIHAAQFMLTTNDDKLSEIIFSVNGTAVTTAPVSKKILVDLVHKPKFNLRDTVAGFIPFFTALKQSGISVTFAETTFAPSGYDIVLIVQPQQNFTAQEAQLLGNYVTNGGTALLLGDAKDNQTAAVLNLLSSQALTDTLGLRLDTTLVLDTVNNVQKNSHALLVTSFTDKKHPLLKGVDTILFVGSASVQTFGKAVPFAKASEKAFVENAPQQNAPAVIGLRNAGKGKILLFGDVDFWKNLAAFNNLTFATNILTVTENYEVKMPEPTPNEQYRIVSIPFDLNDGAISVVLKDLGEPGPYNWRLFGRWNSEKGAYVEYPKTGFSDFKRGEGYWLITKGSKTFNPGKATIVPSQEFYPIKLAPGYNLIGNPFPYKVSWENSLRDSAERIIWKYSGTGFDSVSTTMDAFTGYFVKSIAKESTTIYINPFQITDSKKEKSSARSYAANEWNVNISASDGKANDMVNVAGVSRFAKDEWDELDASEPPPSPTDYLIVTFNRKSWKQNPGSYAVDIRPLTSEGNYWDFTVTSAKKGSRIRLNFNAEGNLPGEFETYLVDMRAERTIALGASSQYDFSMNANELQRSFRLVIGKKEFVEQNTNGIPMTPKEFSLEQNFPNPFNPSTAIRYTLGHSAEVSVVVYNVLGQKVRTLVSEFNSIGTHEVEWDGKNENGTLVSSGVYFYKITATSNNEILFSKTQRMVMLK